MRIAVLTPVFPPYASGMGNVAEEIAEQMGKRGNEVVVVTPEYAAKGRSFTPTVASGLRMTEHISVRKIKPRVTFGNAAWVGSLEGVIPQDTEVVHLHWPFIGVVRALAAWKKRHPAVPIVVTYHMDIVAPGIKGRVFDAYVRRALPKVVAMAEKIVVTSYQYAERSQLEELSLRAPTILSGRSNLTILWDRHARQGLARDDRIIKIPLGVDTARFSPGPKDHVIMARYGLAPEDKVVLTVAALDRAHAFKGIEIVLEATKQLSNLATKLLIVGDGDLRPYYERMARHLGIADRVIFAGRVSDQELPAHYRLADAYVLASTSRSEAFGLSALEAMSSGVPVVASDLAGVRTVVGVDGHNPHPNPLPGSGTRQGEGGVCVPPGDAGALSKAIEELLAHEDRRKQIGEAGRWRAVEQYSWERVGEEYVRLFGGVVRSEVV